MLQGWKRTSFIIFVLLGLVWTFYTRLDRTIWSEITLDHPEKPLTKKELEDFIEESGELSEKLLKTFHVIVKKNEKFTLT